MGKTLPQACVKVFFNNSNLAETFSIKQKMFVQINIAFKMKSSIYYAEVDTVRFSKVHHLDI